MFGLTVCPLFLNLVYIGGQSEIKTLSCNKHENCPILISINYGLMFVRIAGDDSQWNRSYIQHLYDMCDPNLSFSQSIDSLINGAEAFRRLVGIALRIADKEIYCFLSYLRVQSAKRTSWSIQSSNDGSIVISFRRTSIQPFCAFCSASTDGATS